MSCCQFQSLPTIDLGNTTGRKDIVVVGSKVDKLEFLKVGLLNLRLASQIPGGKIFALSYQVCAGDNTKKLTS